MKKTLEAVQSLWFEILFEQEGSEFVHRVQDFLNLVSESSDNNFIPLATYFKDCSDETLLNITQALAHFLNFANLVEERHRIELKQIGPLADFFEKNKKKNKEAIYQGLLNLNIDLVLTAHPTEVNRRTIINKLYKMSDLLAILESKNHTEIEKTKAKFELKKQMTTIWLSALSRHQRPSPVEEAKWGFAVVETSLWKALPNYLKILNEHCKTHASKGLPLDFSPVKFGSWIGGDRDGNPRVTYAVTHEIALLSRWMALDLYEKDLEALKDLLSIDESTMDFLNYVQMFTGSFPAHEPYRVLLRALIQKIQRSKNSLESFLSNKNFEEDFDFESLSIKNLEDLKEPLFKIYETIEKTGILILLEDIADVLRRLAVFGLVLLPMDIRLEARAHTELMEAFCQQLKLPIASYHALSEIEKQNFLVRSLEEPSYLGMNLWSEGLKQLTVLDPIHQETFKTYQLFQKIPRPHFGSYVISMALNPSDLLLVLLFQKQVFSKGMLPILPIVPLFETLEALETAVNTMDNLFQKQIYVKHLVNAEQEIMIGYSDSAKDTGFLAASWAQYQAQKKLSALAKEKKVRLKFFHGRGGSIGRGGWPTQAAILSLPPGTVQGKIRVTQQGEVIRQKFGMPLIALKTLEIYTAATLQASLNPGVEPEPVWVDLMERMSKISAEVYQKITKDQSFIDYFYKVTPCQELGRLLIASRPPKRYQNGLSDLKNLRAIPWVFSWTQNRLLLPVWLGLPESIGAMSKSSFEKKLLKAMWQSWPYFRSLINVIEMVFLKVEWPIFELYDKNFNKQTVYRDYLHGAWIQVLNHIKSLVGGTLLFEDRPMRRSISIRNRYLLPLNHLQLELLKRRRKEEVDNPVLEQALMASIAGIAAGMRNTG
ncbi:MAG: phosphoenolpyruvate carboxylase [Gammaproteobacteria bacterium]